MQQKIIYLNIQLYRIIFFSKIGRYKKLVASLGMNYEKIDVCEKNCMLFWKEHKDDTE
jgi:hypothetical protein